MTLNVKDVVATFDRIKTVPRKHKADALWHGKSLFHLYEKGKHKGPFSSFFRTDLAIQVAEARNRGRRVRPYVLALYETFGIPDQEASELLAYRDTAICGLG